MLLPNNNKSWSVRKYGSHKERGKDNKRGKSLCFMFLILFCCWCWKRQLWLWRKNVRWKLLINNIWKKSGKMDSKMGHQRTLSRSMASSAAIALLGLSQASGLVAHLETLDLKVAQTPFYRLLYPMPCYTMTWWGNRTRHCPFSSKMYQLPSPSQLNQLIRRL